jgi:hypothetical protein
MLVIGEDLKQCLLYQEQLLNIGTVTRLFYFERRNGDFKEARNIRVVHGL